jgi:hypothetical protein
MYIITFPFSHHIDQTSLLFGDQPTNTGQRWSKVAVKPVQCPIQRHAALVLALPYAANHAHTTAPSHMKGACMHPLLLPEHRVQSHEQTPPPPQTPTRTHQIKHTNDWHHDTGCSVITVQSPA